MPSSLMMRITVVLSFARAVAGFLDRGQRWVATLGAALSLAVIWACQTGSEKLHASPSEPPARPPVVVPRGVLVAHALGGIDREANTNSLEALRCNHARGFRWFEVDLALTRDQQLVAFQRGHEKHASLHAPIGELSFTEI